MSRLRRFYKSEDEIIQLLNASDSEDEENVFELDVEDRAVLDGFTDLAKGAEIEIEDILHTEIPSTSKNSKTVALMAKGLPKPKDAKELLVKFQWKKTNQNYVSPAYTDPDYIYGQVLNPKVSADEEVPTVLEVFNAVCEFDTLIDYIIHQTNLYCEQKGIIFSISEEELKAFFGMIIAMSIHRLPQIRLYWSTMEIYSVPFISKVMTRDRFEKILSSLHFVNNAEQPSRGEPSYDRAFKIRPVINHFNSAFGENFSQGKCQSIDEHMVKFKGRNIMKQYMKDKPISWRFKLWCRCDAKSGYLYKIDIYTGKKEQREVGIGESVIILMAAGRENMGIELYFDNFFNSPILLHKLMTNGIRACGTLRKNRAQMPKFDADKSFDRGDFQSFVSKGVSIVKWMDNRAVHMGSNFINPIDTVNVKRRQAGSANKINVSCPKMISQYNAGMGGVDLMDQKKSYYEYDRKSKIRFYLRLFFDLMDLAVQNSHIVYDMISRSNLKPFSIKHLEFRTQLATQLIDGFCSRKVGITSTPRQSVTRSRLAAVPDLAGHYLTRTEGGVRNRCVVCTNWGQKLF